MRYALETTGGVKFFSASTPLPSNAIEPIPNWDEVYHIPWYYLKIVNGNQIVEKTQEEKDLWHQENPQTIEQLREQALTHLYYTDWYISRKEDPSSGLDVPHDIIKSRSEARALL